ncbi:MAG: acyltransferase domain-containing protein [Steroidobacteraceae bacterium]
MKLGILCPGQGHQSRAMLDGLQGEPAAQRVLDEATEALRWDPRELILGSEEALYTNAVAQPLICVAELAIWTALSTNLPEPCVFAGYSVGELAAQACAGALHAAELAELARLRASLMDGACLDDCGLIAVSGLGFQLTERLCAQTGVEIAIVNGGDRFVTGGRCAALDDFEEAAIGAGARIQRLPVAVAAHTRLMQPAARDFRAALAESPLRDPAVRVLAGVDASSVLTRDRAMDTLARQVAEPINWAGCMDALVEAGCTILLELGPGDALARLFHSRHASIPCRSVGEFGSFAGAARWVAAAA